METHKQILTHVLEPIYIPRALNMGTSITKSSETYFILRAHTETDVSHSQHRKTKTRERFGKNAGEWTARVELSKEEIPGSKRSMHGYILTYSRL